MSTQTLYRKSAKTVLLILNVVIFIVILTLSSLHIISEQKIRETSVKQAFSATVSSMSIVAYGNLNSHQGVCNNWAKYINSQNMHMEDALEFLKNINSKSYVAGHIVDYDSMKGFSASKNEGEFRKIDYTDQADSFTDVIQYTLTKKDTETENDNIYISGAYTISGGSNSVVGFCNNITLTENDGSKKDYLLIRVVMISALKETWRFPSEFSDAEISIILDTGEYIIRSNSMNFDNFWEYVQSYNGLSETQSHALTEEMIRSRDIFTLNNSKHNKAYYFCDNVMNQERLMVLGYVPADSINIDSIDWTLILYIFIGLLCLSLVNIMYILNINKKLMISVNEAQEANLAKTRFLSSMSHDIRTPMNAVIGMTLIAEKHLDEPDQIKECLKKINSAGNHLLTLINDILDISKVESGKISLSYAAFSISESITNIVDIAYQQIEEKNITFDINVKNPQYEYIYADELRINQIYINLLTNAVKYTNAGGKIVVTVSEEPCEHDGNKIKLIYSVQDNGIGMDKKFMENMYAAFTRAVDTRIDKIQGSGLGLTITKQMVDLMNGNIECESEINKGTKFVVTLELGIAENNIEPPVLPSVSILLVDDNAEFLETAKETLVSLGASVDTAETTEQALSMACEHHKQGNDYSVIIIDFNSDCLPLVKSLRNEIKELKSKIIINTYDWNSIKEECLSAGADGFIRKPFFKSNVYEKLSEILGTNETAFSDNDDTADDLSGLSLLIAEDNDLNWEIISDLLALYEIKTERAENGKICLDMIKNSEADKYDCILMDVQMPIMNGKEATIAIRKLDDKIKSEIPIIAMTADAFSEDIQSCLNAGMDAHIPKPIDLKKLFKTLRNNGLYRKKF